MTGTEGSPGGAVCPKGHGCYQCLREARERREDAAAKDEEGPMLIFFGCLLMVIGLLATLAMLAPGYDGETYRDNPASWLTGWIMFGGGGLGLVGWGFGMICRRRAAQRRRGGSG